MANLMEEAMKYGPVAHLTHERAQEKDAEGRPLDVIKGFIQGKPGTDANVFRPALRAFFPAVDPGWRRKKQHIHVSHDGTRLNYEYVDVVEG